MKRTYQFHVGPGETLARQPLVGDTLIAGFRNKRAGKVTIMVEVDYDEYDAEREEEAADTLSSYEHKHVGVQATNGGASSAWCYAASNSGVPGGCGIVKVKHIPAGAWEFPKSEEETFAQRYERAMKIVNP